MSLRISATHIESYRLYVAHDFKPEAELLAEIKGEFKATPRMMLGRALHCALEGRPSHEADGWHECYGFRFSPETIAECRRFYRPGGVPEVKAEVPFTVNGEDVTLVCKADRLVGTEVVEHKAILSTFDTDRYAESYQWRCYVVAFRPSAVLYTVYALDQAKGEAEVTLKDTHPICFYPYRGLDQDVQELLERFVHYVHQRGLEPYLQPKDWRNA